MDQNKKRIFEKDKNEYTFRTIKSLIKSVNEAKKNLVNINDYYKYLSNNEHIYIILCNIKFNSKKLQNINFNKLINQNVNEIEKKFIRKYSEVYNLIKFDA